MGNQRYLYFPGCKLNPFLPQYGQSTQAVFAALNIILEEVEFNCCGYPMRHENFAAAMLAAARNLAVASDRGLPLMTPCKCCYGHLKHADHWLQTESNLRRQVNAILSREGLSWRAGVSIRHLLTVLDEDIGAKRLQERIVRPLTGLKVAASYGCHALRPGNITQFDNPLTPNIFERLIATTGAAPVEWPLSLECCGHPLSQKNNRFALSLMAAKIGDAHQSGAQVLATACTYCQLQFDTVQADHASPEGQVLPALLFTQLLGHAMGLSADALGISANRVPWEWVAP